MRRGIRLPPEALAPYLLDVPRGPEAGLLDWKTVFGDDRPVELEVGCGKGLFLTKSAAAHAEINYVGVEVVRKYQLFTATRAAKRGLRNVRVACTDARQMLSARVPTGSLQAVHVYFPDPWWKTRHHKRRVFTGDFVAACQRVLRPGGRLSVATDVPAYFEVMTALVAAASELIPGPPPEASAAVHDLDYLTNFERKFRKQGKPIYRLAAERRDPVGQALHESNGGGIS